MIRSTLLAVAVAALASMAIAQEAQNPTDLLFKEILGEAIPKSTQKQDLQTKPSNQIQPRRIRANSSGGPVVTPKSWGSVQQPFNTPNQTSQQVPTQQTSATRNKPPAITKDQNIESVTGSVSMDLIAPVNINLNQVATIRVHLKNTGKNPLSNIRFIATLPEHVRFESARPQPTKSENGRLEFSAIQLASRSQSYIELDVVPTAKTPMNIGTEIQYANENRIAINVREPALDLQITGPQEMILGESKEYTITVVNRGDGIANNLRFTSQFPEGLQKLRASNTVIPQLAPGQTAQIKVVAQGLASGLKDVQFKLASTELDPINRKTPITILQPELEVTATGPSVNFLNRDGIYKIEIANPGRVNCSNVTIDLAVPTEMNVSTISREAEYNEATRQLTWSFANIPAGKTEIIQLKAQCVAEGQHTCGIVVRSNQTVAKEFRLNTMVATRADVSINISNNSGPVQIGAPAAFEIVVENRGSRSAEDVEIEIALPVALAPAISEEYAINQYDNSIKFNGGEIRSGEKKVFKFSAVGSAQGEHVVRSQLSMSGSNRKIIAEDSVYIFEADQSKVGQKLEPQIRRR